MCSFVYDRAIVASIPDPSMLCNTLQAHLKPCHNFALEMMNSIFTLYHSTYTTKSFPKHKRSDLRIHLDCHLTWKVYVTKKKIRNGPETMMFVLANRQEIIAYFRK